MREIKFRTWDSIHKVMIYFNDVFMTQFSLKNIDNKETFEYYEIISDENDCLVCRAYNEYDDDYGGGIRDVTLFPLQQYTGLKDKNGVEIYENDIVKARYKEKNGYIKWNSTNASFQVKGIPSHTLKRADELEVIGNLYDKELNNEE